MSANERAANGTTGMQPTARREGRREADAGRREAELPSWRRELNDKIAAARARRMTEQPPASAVPHDHPDSNSRASRVAAAVAARYADAPSYSEYLAAEVRSAMMAAVAAQAAANQARSGEGYCDQLATADVASPASLEQPLAESRALPAPPAAPLSAVTLPEAENADAHKPTSNQTARTAVRSQKPSTQPRVDHAASGFPYATPVIRTQEARAGAPEAKAGQNAHSEYVPMASDLSDPLQDALVTPATPLPAKLLEFPRELIAARKARPRHAEGPLRDGVEEEPGQLRIFEVEPSAISQRAETPPQATEWSSIRLDAYPTPDAYPTEDMQGHTGVTHSASPAAYNHEVAESQTQRATRSAARVRSVRGGTGARRSLDEDMLADIAGLADRLMAGIVDAALVGIAFTLFIFVFVASTAHPPSGRPALIASVVVFAFFYLIYQLLFFSFADATPGMRYARIALCTFNDDNPTRDAMRKRIFALVLAAAPLGLGFLYALFDDDSLGWHDRMTRMYQRSYK